MKDVKAISIIEGTVKKIEDSNGNIIWGSYDAFPYRRLEYIKFSGAEYININYAPGTNRSDRIIASFKGNQNGATNGCYASAAVWPRFYIPRLVYTNNTNYLRFSVGGAWSPETAFQYTPDTVYRLYLNTTTASGTVT